MSEAVVCLFCSDSGVVILPATELPSGETYRHAALCPCPAGERFKAAIVEAYEAEKRGEHGRTWSEVKRELLP